jgi:hypothetical protein
VESPDKAAFLSMASPISSPLMGEDKGEGGEVFAKDRGSLYDSCVNPVNMTTVAIHLLINSKS